MTRMKDDDVVMDGPDARPDRPSRRAEVLTRRERRVLTVIVCVSMSVAALSDLALAAAFGWRAMVAGWLCVVGGICWALALGYASMKEHRA